MVQTDYKELFESLSKQNHFLLKKRNCKIKHESIQAKKMLRESSFAGGEQYQRVEKNLANVASTTVG